MAQDNGELSRWAVERLDSVVLEFSADDSDLSRDLESSDAQKKWQKQLLAMLRLRNAIRTAAFQNDDDSYPELLSSCISDAYDGMKRKESEGRVLFGWRRLYTEACLLYSLEDCIASRHELDTAFWSNAIRRLDHAIIIAGAPGDGRLDLILEVIRRIQNAHLPTQITPAEDIVLELVDLRESHKLVNALQEIPCLPRPPSFSSFQSQAALSPFVLRQFAAHWPAIAEGRWSSKSYLSRTAGRGRVVPVEVGADYRTDSWTQRLMDWELFLDYLWPSRTGTPDNEVIYLAQHNLFKQFPDLTSDIEKPDYVFCSMDPPDYFPSYKPPTNEDQLVLNTWFGPAGTISPAHNDPYFNVYVQVVGYKTVWLAPPIAQDAMAAFPDSTSPSSSNPAQNRENPSMSNTSRLDVFSASDTGSNGMDELLKDVVPHAMSLTLGPGDMLFFPPGWWHAMKSETISFSVSMWF